jgi:uncharacterized protein
MNKKVNYPFNILAKPFGPICNLYCSYCFYLKKETLFPHENRSDFAMKPEILESFIRQYIEAQPEGEKEVTFGWQGGEPTLLGVDFFRNVVKLQKKYNVRGLTVKNGLQTNGTLITDEFAKFLKEEDFLVGISIDGPEYLHNKYRLDREGKGSFSRVMAGLENLKKNNVDFNTLTVVQNDNSKHPFEVYRFLKDVGSTFLQFIPIVEPDNGQTKKLVSKRTVSPEDWGTFLVAVFQDWIKEDIGNIYVQHFDLILGLYIGEPASLCVHSKYCGKALAIEHNGNMYSCDHFVSPDTYLGNISGSLAEIVEGEKQQRFGKNKFDLLPEECLVCPYLSLCYGGCPKDRLIAGRKGKLNWLCEGYKYFYETTAPVFSAMAAALKHHRPASTYKDYFCLPPSLLSKIGRNDPCPCLSGKKLKNCHGQR